VRPKHTTVITNVEKLDNKSIVTKSIAANTTRKIGFTTAVTIPRTAAEVKASPGVSISTPSAGILLKRYKLKPVNTQTIKIDRRSIVKNPEIEMAIG
jgi:hypothetical protein